MDKEKYKTVKKALKGEFKKSFLLTHADVSSTAGQDVGGAIDTNEIVKTGELFISMTLDTSLSPKDAARSESLTEKFPTLRHLDLTMQGFRDLFRPFNETVKFVRSIFMITQLYRETNWLHRTSAG